MLNSLFEFLRGLTGHVPVTLCLTLKVWRLPVIISSSAFYSLEKKNMEAFAWVAESEEY